MSFSFVQLGSTSPQFWKTSAELVAFAPESGDGSPTNRAMMSTSSVDFGRCLPEAGPDSAKFGRPRKVWAPLWKTSTCIPRICARARRFDLERLLSKAAYACDPKIAWRRSCSQVCSLAPSASELRRSSISYRGHAAFLRSGSQGPRGYTADPSIHSGTHAVEPPHRLFSPQLDRITRGRIAHWRRHKLGPTPPPIRSTWARIGRDRPGFGRSRPTLGRDA